MSPFPLRPIRQGCTFLLAALIVAPWTAAAEQSPPAPTGPAPLTLTAQQDRQLMLDQLKIAAKTMRPGVNGSNPKAPNYQNTDESKANPCPDLPNMMVTKSRKQVTTEKIWWEERRPEIVESFDAEVYGRVPKDVPKVTWEIAPAGEAGAGGGGIGGRGGPAPTVPVVTKQLVGKVDNSSYPAISVNIRLTLTLPAGASGPVPVMMDFGGGGGRNQYFAKGWGYALVNPGSIQADNGEGLTRGIIGLVNKGQARKPEDWGSLRAWAWGASRAGLPGNQQSGRREAGGDFRSVSLWQGGTGCDGLRAAFCHRPHRVFRRGRSQAVPPQLGRAS